MKKPVEGVGFTELPDRGRCLLHKMVRIKGDKGSV